MKRRKMKRRGGGGREKQKIAIVEGENKGFPKWMISGSTL